MKLLLAFGIVVFIAIAILSIQINQIWGMMARTNKRITTLTEIINKSVVRDGWSI